jgi:mRNA interferase MazF
MHEVKRGQIWLVDLGNKNGSIQGFLRPMIVVSNLMACRYSPVIHAVPTTGQINKKWIPTHVDIPMSSGLLKPSIALCEQVQLLTKEDFITQVGVCDDYIMSKINQALMVQFELVKQEEKNKIIS